MAQRIKLSGGQRCQLLLLLLPSISDVAQRHCSYASGCLSSGVFICLLSPLRWLIFFLQRAATTLAAGFPRVTQRVSFCFATVTKRVLIFCPSQQQNMAVYILCVLLSESSRIHLPIPPAQVTLIPGDGIGQEITNSVKEIFEHVNAPIEWEQYDVSGMSSSGEALFKQAMDSLKRNRVGLKGQSFWPCFCDSPLTSLQAFFSPPSPSLVTSHGTSPCASNSISTPQLCCASPSPDSLLVIPMSTSPSSVKTQRESTPAWNIRATPVSLRV